MTYRLKTGFPAGYLTLEEFRRDSQKYQTDHACGHISIPPRGLEDSFLIALESEPCGECQEKSK